jgi:hypothetical protein
LKFINHPFAELNVASARSFHTAVLLSNGNVLVAGGKVVDGFLGAYWARPEAYLDAGVRSAISGFAKLANVGPGLARLRADLASGAWERRFGALRARESIDLGYRLVVAESA